ncbi:hypothetical protein PMIT1313_01891 [Prochlorococcus marinus str. MIT 1313]|nr:hypothetical protein PMIT1313_01891 [Prochlorococcus marinus str. MIT 1313]KZR71483.1 hypothetical protein PMIT1318_02635 [Prochlorococcus marinus str. MIT 1318]
MPIAVSFSPYNEKSDRQFNNADNFAMIFDEAWKNYQSKEGKTKPSQETKLNLVLDTIKDHPFLLRSPSIAKEVAQFRIRLLDLI